MSKRSTRLGWFLGIAIAFSANSALAQITPDSTLGVERSLLTPNVQINGVSGDRIEGGAQRASNLFHSFSQFNINNGQRVYFANPTGIQNILTRVTGKESSNIFGTLGVEGSANLFLLNPNGILFGQNARLDVRGSFLGTTANSFVFPNGLEFSATNPQAPPLLTITAPIGLQFGSQPGGITSQSSQLIVGGSTLALIGGEIALDGSFLFANNGQVQLGAVGGETTVDLNVNGSKLNFNLPENASRAPITLTNEAFVATSGDSAIKLVGGQINLNGSFISGQNGGSISINATGLGLDNGSNIQTGTQGATKAGDIQIQASDAVTLANSSRILSNSRNSATGNGGNIAINARKIAVTGDGIPENSGSISTLTLGQGNAGNLTLNATDSVNINGGSVFVATGGAGNAGNLTVQARNAVNVTDIGKLEVLSNGSGSTGNLRIETGTLRVQNTNLSGGVTAMAAGSGSVGSISIQARDAVEVINSAINAQVASGSAGRAGDITIETPRVNLKDGGQVRTDTFSSANAGNIIIRASEFVDISGISPSTLDVVLSSQVSSGTTLGATGNGGNITIPTGNGGNITLETPRLSLNQGGSVSTSSFKSRGNAGNITIRAKDVQLDGFVTIPNGERSFASKLNSEVQGSDANVRGGTITTPNGCG
jgi:filamentous hemagglutinin family protein